MERFSNALSELFQLMYDRASVALSEMGELGHLINKGQRVPNNYMVLSFQPPLHTNYIKHAEPEANGTDNTTYRLFFLVRSCTEISLSYEGQTKDKKQQKQER